MRKLKLQVQSTPDGYICGLNGELDFMTWNWDEGIKKYVSDLTDSIDTILMGRKMAPGFMGHWTGTMNDPANPEYEFGKKMMETSKVIFSKTLDPGFARTSGWKNTIINNGDLGVEVKKLKASAGKDIIAYGGAGFDASLIRENLVDEYYLFINPAVLGEGLSIFKDTHGKRSLELVNSIKFDCGIVLLNYKPKEV
jgi:dihydrofolate reductase